MNWNKEFWESIKVDLMNTNLEIDANNLLSLLESKNLCNREFLKTHCHGYDKFKDYLLGNNDGIKKNSK